MLVETGGVRTYTPGRGNVEAAKTGEQANEPQRKKDSLLSTAAKETTEN
jgi:hypothetical protein